MAPPRRAITTLGECLRAAREALHLDQAGLGKRVFVSARLVSRWENGHRPSPAQADRIFDMLSSVPEPLVSALADALGIELAEDEEELAPVVPLASPPVERPQAATLRASFNAVILAAAESRDVLPRHLRGFAVEMFREAERLGVSAGEAALLVVAEE